jgi:hypothetical protein
MIQLKGGRREGKGVIERACVKVWRVREGYRTKESETNR